MGSSLSSVPRMCSDTLTPQNEKLSQTEFSKKPHRILDSAHECPISMSLVSLAGQDIQSVTIDLLLPILMTPTCTVTERSSVITWPSKLSTGELMTAYGSIWTSTLNCLRDGNPHSMSDYQDLHLHSWYTALLHLFYLLSSAWGLTHCPQIGPALKYNCIMDSSKVGAVFPGVVVITFYISQINVHVRAHEILFLRPLRVIAQHRKSLKYAIDKVLNVKQNMGVAELEKCSGQWAYLSKLLHDSILTWPVSFAKKLHNGG